MERVLEQKRKVGGKKEYNLQAEISFIIENNWIN